MDEKKWDEAAQGQGCFGCFIGLISIITFISAILFLISLISAIFFIPASAKERYIIPLSFFLFFIICYAIVYLPVIVNTFLGLFPKKTLYQLERYKYMLLSILLFVFAIIFARLFW